MSPVFGYWSNRIHSVKIPIVTASGTLIIGNIIYILAQFGTGSKLGPALVLIGRLFMGSGAGIWGNCC